MTKVGFTNVATPTQKVEMIAQGPGMVLEMTSGGTYVLTISVPGHPDEVQTGTWHMSGDVLMMRQTGMPVDSQFNATLPGTTLTLAGADTDFDSDGAGEPAKLRLVLTK